MGTSMIEVKVSDDMLLEARVKSIEMGRLHNSIINGGGNLVGFIGEAIAQEVLGGVLENTYDYDLVLSDGTLVDVKTKSTSVAPLPTYDCSIAAFNPNQKCDFYAFVRVKKDLSVGWYLGVYNKQQYFDDAVFMQKGTIDPSNGYVVKSSCYNLKISQLKETI
jgi:hypothetical protein